MPRLSRRLVAFATILAVSVGLIAVQEAAVPTPADAHPAQCPSEPILHSADLVPIPHQTNFQCKTPLSFNCGSNSVWLEIRSGGYGPLDSTGRFQFQTVQGDGSEKTTTSAQRETDHRGMRWRTGFQHLVFVSGQVLDTHHLGYSEVRIGCQAGGPSITYFSW